MQEDSNNETREALEKWVKNQLNSCVNELIDQGAFSSVMVEAKPAWVFPFGILIGMVREQDQKQEFDWFITGDFPTARVHSTVASTAREAARHFALQWQLEAKKLEDSADDDLSTENLFGIDTKQSVDDLVKRAQSLYELVEEDSLWQEAS